MVPFPHHVMAGPVPAVPILQCDALCPIEITGTGPVMTTDGMCQENRCPLSPSRLA